MKLKNRKRVLIIFSIISLLIFTSLSGCVERIEHVTHFGVGVKVLKKEEVVVFYNAKSQTQKYLAEEALDLIYDEYLISSEILDLPMEDLDNCSLVFCEENDLYVRRCGWVSYIDGVIVWPVIGEESLSFENSINGWLLYHMLTHEIVDMTLRENNVNAVYGAWFIEGVSEYVRILYAESIDHLNDTFWLETIKEEFDTFSGQEDRVVDLSDRSSFDDFAGPGTSDGRIFYVGSLVYIYDLVKKYGDEFISDAVENECKSYEDLRSSIENSTGYDISNSIKSVTVRWIKQKYISLLDELNVDYK